MVDAERTKGGGANGRAAKVPVPRDKALRLLNSGATVLVSSASADARSVLTVAWQMPASIDPPLAVVSIGHLRYSYEVMRRAEAFVINIPTEAELTLVKVAGTVSGRERDKFEGMGLTPEPGVLVPVPRVAECPGHVECRLVAAHPCGDHTLFVGEVAGAFATEAFFDGRLRVEGEARTLHHLGGSFFHLPGQIVRI